MMHVQSFLYKKGSLEFLTVDSQLPKGHTLGAQNILKSNHHEGLKLSHQFAKS